MGLRRLDDLRPEISFPFLQRRWTLQCHLAYSRPRRLLVDVDVLQVNITDNTPPIPLISVNGVLIEEQVSILTEQLILFSASLTVDNVPTQNLSFDWNWGDGSLDSGIGLFEAAHEWGDINGINETYNLTLTVSDGNNIGIKTITVIVNNRIPYQIFSDNLSTSTYNSIVMHDVFKDSDGSIVFVFLVL